MITNRIDKQNNHVSLDNNIIHWICIQSNVFQSRKSCHFSFIRTVLFLATKILIAFDKLYRISRISPLPPNAGLGIFNVLCGFDLKVSGARGVMTWLWHATQFKFKIRSMVNITKDDKYVNCECVSL